MALNFAGVGFNFGAKDAGLKKATRGYASDFADLDRSANKLGQSGKNLGLVSKGVDLIKTAIGKLNDILRQNKLQTWMQALTMGPLKGAADRVRSLGGETLNLTTSLEATMTSSAKTSRFMAVQMGAGLSDLSKLSGKAVGIQLALNTSTETATKALINFNAAQKEMKAVGITSAKQFAKLVDLGAVDADEFRSTLQTMMGVLKLSPGAMKEVTSSFFTMSQKTMNVSGGMKGLGEIVADLQNIMVQTGKRVNDMQLARIASGAAAVKAGLFAAGVGAEGANTAMRELMKATVESHASLAKMFSGTESDVSEFTKQMSIMGGNVDGAMKKIQSGPEGITAGFAEMFQMARSKGLDTGEIIRFISNRLEKAGISAEAAHNIALGFDRMDEATLKAMADVKKASVDLGKFADKAHTTGRTLQESFDLAQQSAVMMFRSISRKESVKFVQDFGRESAAMGKKLKVLAKDDGPLGLLVTKMSTLHQLGAVGMLPEGMRSFGAVAGTMVKEATPTIAMLGALGLRFTHLVNPVVLATAAIAGLVFLFKGTENRMKKMDKGFQSQKRSVAGLEKQFGKMHKGQKGYEEMQARLVKERKKLNELDKKISEKARKRTIADIKKFALRVKKAIVGFARKLPDILKTVWQVIKELWQELKVGDAMKSLGAWLKGIKWKEVFQTGLAVLKDIGKWIWGFLSEVDWLGLLKSAWDISLALWETIAGALGEAFDWLMSLDYGQAVSDLLGWLTKVADAAAVRVGPVFQKITEKVGPIFEKAGDKLVEVFQTVPPKVGQGLKDLAPKIRERLPEMTEAGLNLAEALVKAVVINLPKKLIKAIPGIIKGLGKMLEGVGELILNTVLGILGGIEQWLIKKFPDSAQEIHAVFQWLAEKLTGFWDGFKAKVEMAVTVIKVLVKVMKVMGGTVITIFKHIWTVASYVIGAIGAVIKFTWENVIRPVWEVLRDTAEKVWTFVSDKASWLGDQLKIVWDDVSGWFTSAWEGIRGTAERVWNWISEKVTGIWTSIESTWSGAPGFFSSVWEGIKGAILLPLNLILGLFEKVRDTFLGGFDAIWDKVQVVFGKSVNTVVAKDMEKTIEVMQKATDQVSSYVEKGLYEAVVRGLVNAFVTAFKSLTQLTDKFAGEEIKKFEKMTATIVRTFRAMWIDMLKQTEQATDAIAKDMAGIFAKMEALLKVMRSAEKTRLEARAEAAPQAEHPAPALGRSATQDDLYKAIHDPAWWSGVGGFKGIFREEMAGLRAAVAAGGGPGARTGGASEKTRREFERAQRGRPTRIGGLTPAGGA